VIIDAHLHIGLNNHPEDHFLDLLDRRGVDKAWVLTWDELDPVLPDYYIPLDIETVSRTFRKHPDRIVPFYAPDPARKNWKDLLTKRLDEGFAGCGELKVPYNWDAAVMQPLLEYLNQHSLPLIFHMEQSKHVFTPGKDRGIDWLLKRLVNERFNGRTAHIIQHAKKRFGIGKRYLDKRLKEFPGYLQGFNELKDALEKYPNIRFVAHGPHFWNHISIPEKHYLFLQDGRFNGKGEAWKLLEDFPNLYCDISGHSGATALKRDEKMTGAFLEQFGNKILFGTDNTNFGMRELVEKHLTEKEKRDAVLYKNALSLTGK